MKHAKPLAVMAVGFLLSGLGLVSAEPLTLDTPFPVLEKSHSSSPVGDTFTAVLTNVRLAWTTLSGTPFGIPKSGTQTLTPSKGYTGTQTYSLSDGAYKLDGDIYYAGSQVVDIHLTFDVAFGNYSGYYTDLTTGLTHTIE